jgi:hypothetical protein
MLGEALEAPFVIQGHAGGHMIFLADRDVVKA